ncbi:MAG: hypothetical protein WCS73_07660 [Lentisphaeria bacterium]
MRFKSIANHCTNYKSETVEFYKFQQKKDSGNCSFSESFINMERTKLTDLDMILLY